MLRCTKPAVPTAQSWITQGCLGHKHAKETASAGNVENALTNPVTSELTRGPTQWCLSLMDSEVLKFTPPPQMPQNKAETIPAPTLPTRCLSARAPRASAQEPPTAPAPPASRRPRGARSIASAGSAAQRWERHRALLAGGAAAPLVVGK